MAFVDDEEDFSPYFMRILEVGREIFISLVVLHGIHFPLSCRLIDGLDGFPVYEEDFMVLEYAIADIRHLGKSKRGTRKIPLKALFGLTGKIIDGDPHDREFLAHGSLRESQKVLLHHDGLATACRSLEDDRFDTAVRHETKRGIEKLLYVLLLVVLDSHKNKG